MQPRLLVISPSCYQPINRAVFRELAGRDIAVHLVVPKRYFIGGIWRKTKIKLPEGYTLSHLEIRGTNMRLQYFQGLRDVVKQFTPTHVYVDADPAGLLVVQASLAARQSKLSAITAENIPPDSLNQLTKAIATLDVKSVAHVLIKTLLRRFSHLFLDRVFTLSEDGKRIIEAMGQRTTKLPLGYDPELFFVQELDKRAATRTRLGLTKPTIAYFGRVVPEKGIHHLVSALAQLKDLRWQFLLDRFSASGGTYVEDITYQIEAQGFSNRLIFFEVCHEEMPDFINATDLVVLPSIKTLKWKEQYGRIIQEAQACGRIVIGSDSGAIPETMDGHGHLFPEGDATALSALLRSLLTSNVFFDLEAAKSAKQNRSIQRQADILETYIRET